MAANSLPNASVVLLNNIDKIFPEGVEFDCHGLLKPLAARAFSRLRLAVARDLFGETFKSSAALNSYLERQKQEAGGHQWSDPYLAKLNPLNEAMLPVQGYGEDSFWLNAYIPEGGMRAFDTLGDYDRFRYQAHQEVNKGSGLAGPDYFGHLYGEFGRWLEGGKIVYGSMSMASSVLFMDAYNAASDLLSEVYPYEIDFAPEGSAFVMVADNKEHEAAHKYGLKLVIAECHRRMGEEWVPYFEKQEPLVYVERVEPFCEDSRKVVFMNCASLDAVRIDTFVRDLRVLQRPLGEYEVYSAFQIDLMRDWVKAEVLAKVADYSKMLPKFIDCSDE